MAIITDKQTTGKVLSFDTPEVEKPIVEALDKVAENSTPFLKQENNGNLTVMGDPTLVAPTPLEEYEITLVLPTNEFDKSEWATILKETNDQFMVEVKATQEKITPYNRTFLSSVAVDFLALFFVDKEDDGNFELLTGADLANATLRYFRTDSLIENTKFFVGKLLGLDDKYSPYLLDTEVVTLAVQLILANPSLINEAYFTVKP